MLCFAILGPVRVHRSVELRGPFQRTLLATLLVNAGRLVTVDALIREMWGEDFPRRVENALQAHVSRLRRKLNGLEPDRPSSRLASLPSGYHLSVEPDELDAARFTRTLNEVRARPEKDPAEAVDRLREALSLWHGPALSGSVGGPACQAAAARYEEWRTAALELLYEYETRLGRHATVIAELSELVAGDSLNERFCGQLMLALYRAGRQTEALAVYRRMWSRLNEELGVDPSPQLRNYERAILAHDPALLAGLPAGRSALADAPVLSS